MSSIQDQIAMLEATSLKTKPQVVVKKITYDDVKRDFGDILASSPNRVTGSLTGESVETTMTYRVGRGLLAPGQRMYDRYVTELKERINYSQNKNTSNG